MSKSLHRAAVLALLTTGCHGLSLVATGGTVVTTGATVVTLPPFDRWDCNLKRDLVVPGGTLLIDSEEMFRANFECQGNPGSQVATGSGVDFSRDLVAVFLGFGTGNAPKFARIERKGDRLTGIFRVERYCGGAQPYPMMDVQSFLVRRAPITLESKTIELAPIQRCPTNLP